MESVAEVSGGGFGLQFDPTLVRGMGYYTGTIFEVSMEGFGGSVAGGGRYDRMVGKFTGTETPACGFSIGFERIITILMDSGFRIPDQRRKKAFLYEKNLSAARVTELLKEAAAEREAGSDVLVVRMAKNKKFQKEQLSAQAVSYTHLDVYKRQRKRRGRRWRSMLRLRIDSVSAASRWSWTISP